MRANVLGGTTRTREYESGSAGKKITKHLLARIISLLLSWPKRLARRKPVATLKGEKGREGPEKTTQHISFLS